MRELENNLPASNTLCDGALFERDQRSELVCRARLKALAFRQEGLYSLSGFARLWSKGEGGGQRESGQWDNFLAKGFHCPVIRVSARTRRGQDGLFYRRALF